MGQIFTIHATHPQARFINQAVDILKQQGVIVFPTESGYSIGCLLDNKRGFDKICQIRQIDNKHNFTLMCRDLTELSTLAKVDNIAFRRIKNNTPGSYTFILNATKEVPRRLMNDKRKTVGLRIPGNPIALALLAELNMPLMSVTLILPGNEHAEFDPQAIDDKIGHQVDAIIDGGYIAQQPTTVIDLTEDTPVIIRRGSGDTAPFEID